MHSIRRILPVHDPRDRPGSFPAAQRRDAPGELAGVFLKLGTIAFGGPAAHIAMMEDEVVTRRGWLTRGAFVDLIGATNLIPGPNSTELAIHIGHSRAGWRGLLVAGVCFIVPAVAIVGVLAAGYVRYGTLPEVAGVLHGLKPVVIAIVLQAVWRLGRTALRSDTQMALFSACLIGALLGVSELVLLFGAGAVSAALGRRSDGAPPAGAALPAALPAWQHASAAVTGAGGAGAAAFGLLGLFGVFLKIGSVLFGSGYVLLAFLRSDLVMRLGWLTERQLLDAVAVGQVTPGPVFTTAAFIGYILGGAAGAAVATVGIFLPAFIFVALSGPLIPRIRASATASRVLDGVNAASLALMAAVTWALARTAVVDVTTAALALLSAAVLLFVRINTGWLLLAGAIAGLVAPLSR